MWKFDDILSTAVDRHGAAALEARLPAVADAATLAGRPDAWYLSTLTRRIFRAGLRHATVDARWPAFEEAFFGFDPARLVLMPDDMLEDRMRDPRLIRHRGKIRAIPFNAKMVLDISREAGGFGHFLAGWPLEDTAGLWKRLARSGQQLGGNSAPAFLRMVERDTWMPTADVAAALKGQGVIESGLSSQREREAAQRAFNAWHGETGRPLAHLSRILAMTVG